MGNSREAVGSAAVGEFKPVYICATTALWVRIGGAFELPLQTGLCDGRGRLTSIHAFWAQGPDATRKHLAHSLKLVSSNRNLKTMCCAEVPVCHNAGDLRCRLFRCLLRLAINLKEFSGASLTRQDVNGHVGTGMLAALLVSVGGGIPAAESGCCECGWVMAGVG